MYSAKGYSFFFNNTAPDSSLLIADAPSYAWAEHLEGPILSLWGNSKIPAKCFTDVFLFAQNLTQRKQSSKLSLLENLPVN